MDLAHADLPTTTAEPTDDRGTMVDLFLRNVEHHGDVMAIVDGDRRITWSEYGDLAATVALALADLGVGRGDTVGLHMVNRAEHMIGDIGALLAGATPTSFYYTLSPEQLTYVASDVGAKVVVVDANLLPLWQNIRSELPDLEHIVVLDHDEAPEGTIRWEDLVGGIDVEARRAELDEVLDRRSPDDPLTVIYTSGTTGPPKGVVITQGGLRFTTTQGSLILGDAVPKLGRGPHERFLVDGRLKLPPGLAILSYLPLAHVAERFASHYASLYYCWTVNCVRDLEQLPAALPAVRPDSFVAVPRVWEKFLAGITARLSQEPNDRKRALGENSIEVAREFGMAKLEGRKPSLSLRARHTLFERLVYSKLRAAMGLDRCLLAWSGAAPISPDVLATFTGLGFVISEVYGMTESSTLITVTPPGQARIGTVGIPLGGIELEIADDGEVLTRGPHVTPGYLNKPEATAAAIDEDGWLHTGDLGEIDEAGYLKIIGRKKELIILASGKNISPNSIEEPIKAASPLIGQVLAHGDGLPYITALLVLDPEATEAWCARNGVEFTSLAAAADDPAVIAEIQRAVDAGNERLARIEQVKRFVVLGSEWTPQSGELTPSMKLKRRVVEDRYAGDLAALYDRPTSARS